VNGRRLRTGFEARWRPGPVSIQSEYIRVTDERKGQSVEDTDLSSFLAQGWYVSGSFALTGEQKSNGLDEPRRPFLRGGLGAIELAARFEKLSFGSAAAGPEASTSPRADAVLGNSDVAVTLGVNWYLNRWVKIQANLIRERIEDPSRGPLPAQAGFWSRVLRFQLSL
jgi:phosphate-selective porin OprO/OprP